MFRINDFARLAGVSIRMLRHYDHIGLLVPAYVDARTRYRSYTADQLVQLRRIVALKELGFPLDQIAPLLARDISTAELRRSLDRRRAEVTRRMYLDRARLLDLDGRLSDIEPGSPRRSDIVIRPVAAQLMATIRQAVPSPGPPVEELFDEAEAHVARYRARAALSPLMIFHGDVKDTPLDVEVGIPLVRATPTTDRIALREVPGSSTMACVVYAGGYERTEAALLALRAWADANGWAVAGPPREVYVRFGADHADALRLPRAFLTDERNAYVTEVQLPLEPPKPLRS